MLPHPAATVILLRPAATGFEVLLLRRSEQLAFAADRWVFPGGRIDAADAPGQPRESLPAARAAAARETLEEAGLRVNSEHFLLWSYWLTPAGKSRRFSTWFLLGDVSTDQSVEVDQGEIVEARWLTPAEALLLQQRGELPVLPPAIITLQELAGLDSIAAARAFCQDRQPPAYKPRIMIAGDRTISAYEEDCAYLSGDPESEGPQHRSVMIDGIWHYVRRP
nr:NUDIX hydrolase [Pseudomaricurvus sp. HS19]